MRTEISGRKMGRLCARSKLSNCKKKQRLSLKVTTLPDLSGACQQTTFISAPNYVCHIRCHSSWRTCFTWVGKLQIYTVQLMHSEIQVHLVIVDLTGFLTASRCSNSSTAKSSNKLWTTGVREFYIFNASFWAPLSAICSTADIDKWKITECQFRTESCIMICRDFVEIGGQLTSDPHKITGKVGVGC